MIGLGTIVNIVLILVGGGLGLLLKKFLSDRLTDTIMQGLGLAVIIIGLSGTLGTAFIVVDNEISAQYTLMMILSLALGALIGELVNIEKKLNDFAKICENKFDKDKKNSTFAQGFITATLVFCVGAMSVVGALEDGINGNPDILYAKAALDGIAAMVFASTMGIGVLFSIFAVGLYQGLITLLSTLIAPYLNDAVIAQMSMIGSILILGIGLNMLKITKIKVGNLLPSIFIPVLYYIIMFKFY